MSALRPGNGRFRTLLMAALLVFSLTACGGGYRPRFDPATASAGGVYKVGNPYKVGGRWYHPKEDPYYDRTGIASWYGRKFHGHRTANGEIFDMNGFSAAHTTLPMPSYVKVTNLANGRSLVLRVNDRGPFVGNRIIDLSRRAAQELGYAQRGTARVRVVAVREPVGELFVLARGTTTQAERDFVVAAPAGAVRSERLAPPRGTLAAARATPPAAVERPTLLASRARGFTRAAAQPAPTDRLYVQAGAFSDPANARQLKNELGGLGPTDLATVTLGGTRYYRVRIGPLESMELADKTLTTVINRGHPDARIVVD